MSDDYDDWTEAPSHKMSRDLRLAAATLGDHEARFLVSQFYGWQNSRKQSDSRTRVLYDSGEPHEVIKWLGGHSANLEGQIRLALNQYVESHLVGPWLKSQIGIGPVLGAGLLAHIYMKRWCSWPGCRGHNEADCKRRQADKKRKLEKHKFQPTIATPTVGKIYQFAGIAGDGQRPWLKKTKRPFNAELKTLCWKVSQSFVYLSNHPQCKYGHLYQERKAYETVKNANGDYADQAAHKLKTTDIGKDTDAYRFYSMGRLPPGHIDSRARRFCVKRFLANLHHEWYKLEYGDEPPFPFPKL